MKVTVCDRCKQQQDEVTEIELKLQTRLRGPRWIRPKRTFDLCESCLVLLHEWLENRG